jgi:Tfp pilus assembly protein PilF
VSLIADSLKKAVKEKSAPKWESDPEINPVGRREPIKRPGLSTVFRILLLIVLPTGILVYLISIGAFSLKKTPVTQKPDLPVSTPLEEARVTPSSKPAPKVPMKQPVAVSPAAKPTKQASAEEATVAQKTSGKPLASKKEKSVVKKVVPSNASKKTTKKPKEAIVSIPVIPDEKAVALSAPELQSKIPLVATGKKIPAVPLILVKEKPKTETTSDLKAKGVAPEENSEQESSEVEIPDHEIATGPESSVKSSISPVSEKPQGSLEQKIIAPVITENKNIAVPPVALTETPVGKNASDLEKKEGTPEEIPALRSSKAEIPEQKVTVKPEAPAQPQIETVLEKPQIPSEQKTVVPVITGKEIIGTLSQPMEKHETEATPDLELKGVASEEIPALKSSEAEIPEQKVAVKPEAPAQPQIETVLEKSQASRESKAPKISDTVKENQGKPAIEIQKKNPEVVSLPPSTAKPEIFRVEPRGQENVFNNSDYYFNRGIFFQQARDWQKALVNYSKAEELDPNNPDTYNNKGVVLKEMGKFDKALDEFLRAVFLDAGYAKAYNNIGVVYYMQKNYPEAIRHYLKAIDINPTNLEAFNNLAIIYKKQKELDKARGVLNRALALNPDHPGTNYNLAVLYEENSEIKPALHFYRRFIELGAINYPSLVTQVKEHLAGMGPQ